MNAPRATVASFVARVALRHGDGDWLVLIVPLAELSVTQEALVDELTLRSVRLSVVSRPEDASALVKALTGFSHGTTVIVTRLEEFAQDDWKSLDAMRSMLNRDAPVILLVSRREVDALASAAPNLFSWASRSGAPTPSSHDRPTPSRPTATCLIDRRPLLRSVLQVSRT